MKNVELIKKFYDSFANADIEGMISCYHKDIEFEDPAFGLLKGEQAKNMWRMLLERGGKIKIESSNIKANEKTGSANWRADYVYSGTKRKVTNLITAKFEFQDGKIIKHTDDFDLWKWTKQALGISGYLLGWSSFMKKKINQQTNSLLKKYTAKRQEGK